MSTPEVRLNGVSMPWHNGWVTRKKVRGSGGHSVGGRLRFELSSAALWHVGVLDKEPLIDSGAQFSPPARNPADDSRHVAPSLVLRPPALETSGTEKSMIGPDRLALRVPTAEPYRTGNLELRAVHRSRQ
jgi:hypothetical protein